MASARPQLCALGCRQGIPGQVETETQGRNLGCLHMSCPLRGRSCLTWPDRDARSGCPHSQRALPSNEQLHQAQMATGGRGVQRCPALAVAGIDPGPSFQELLHHLPEVIDAALWSAQPECPSPHRGPSLPSHRQQG